MKSKLKLLSCTMLILLLVLGFGQPVSGQGKAVISTGFGIPELMNLGAQYQFHQCQIGLSVGTLPSSSEHIMTISGDLRYHFAGYSNLSGLHPWYGKLGLSYLRDETPGRIENYMYLNARVGRDFDLTDKLGINFDVGAIYELNKKVIQKTDTNWYLPMNWHIIPSISFGLYYKI